MFSSASLLLTFSTKQELTIFFYAANLPCNGTLELELLQCFANVPTPALLLPMRTHPAIFMKQDHFENHGHVSEQGVGLL